MADVKWIKIYTDIFDNRKIKQIEAMQKGDALIVIWIKLICLAGTINDNGRVYFTNDIPYTPEMLAAQFSRPVQTVRLALDTFERFGMIDRADGFITLPSWGKYQSADKLEKMSEGNRKRQAKHRKKIRDGNVTDCNEDSLDCEDSNVTSNVTCNEEEKEKEKEEEKDRENKTTRGGPGGPSAQAVDYKAIQAMYNDICVSLPQCKVLSEARKGAIRARMRAGYTPDDFMTLFQKAADSNFLTGANKRNWSADFDWLIADANMAKVLDGKYDNRSQSASGSAQQGRQDDTWDNMPEGFWGGA